MLFNTAVMRVAWSVLLFGTSIFAATTDSNRAKIRSDFVNVPFYFEANQGQADPSWRYLARGAGLRAAVRYDGITLRAYGRSTAMHIVGADRNAAFVPEGPTEGISNYYLGRRVISGLQHYARVRANSVLPGIDVSYYGSGNNIEYDFVIHSSADPESIRLQFDGAAKPVLDASGDLMIATELGEIRQRQPRVWQEMGGVRREISCQYRIDRSGEVRLGLGRFDRKRELTIDPILSISTFLGGSADDNATGIAVDASGDIYVAGYTESTDFPSTSGRAIPTGAYDVFVTKLNRAGSGILYSTIIAGTADDRANAIALDSAGNAYVAGYTWSSDFPNTTGAPAGVQDAFAVKLGPSGNLIYSNVFGGSLNDVGNAVAVDSTGSAYVAGLTASNNFPVVGTPLRTGLGGSYDAFITKFTPAGAISYSKNFGGQGQDGVNAVAIDSSGNAYVAGSTTSSDFPATGYQTTNRASNGTAFVSVINPSGDGYVYSTYLGGSYGEWATGIAVDATGAAYVSGTTSSVDFPTTPNSFTPVKPNSGFSAAFITKLNPTGATLAYSTYLAGSSNEGAHAIAVDSHGSAYVTGSSESNDFPTTPGALKRTKNNIYGDFDAFMVEVSPDGGALSYSTLLGSDGSDLGTSIALDQNGGVYVTGTTTSRTLPTTADAYQSANPKGTTNFSYNTPFIAKIDMNSPTMCSASVNPTSVTLPGHGGTFSFNLTLAPGCPWDTSEDSFITLTGAVEGMGSSSPIPITGSVGVNNNIGSSIAGAVHVDGATFTVNQNGGSCTDPVFNPTSASFDANGGLRTIAITLPSSCSWTVASSAPWLSVGVNPSGTGSGSTTIYTSGNSFSQRTATLSIASKTIPITQTGSTCTATASATGTGFSGAGGTGLVQITPNSQSCYWTAYSLAPWIQVTTSSGLGTGSTSFVVASNPGLGARMGGILIGDQTINITQSGGPAGVINAYSPTLFAGNGNPSAAGDGGPAITASLDFPDGIAFDPTTSNVYIADRGNNRIRVVTPDGNINTFAGGGGSSAENISPTAAALVDPVAVAVDSMGAVYITDNDSRVRKITQGHINTIAGGTTPGFGGDNGPAASAQLRSPSGLAVDTHGNLYISDSGNGRIREVTNSTITTLAGGGASNPGDGGSPTNAALGNPQEIAVDSSGNLYFADFSAGRIRKIANNVISTVAGGGNGTDGGPATSAYVYDPTGVTLDPGGNLFLTDQSYDAVVRKVDSNGIISTVWSSSYPTISSLAADTGGNLYVSIYGYNMVYKLTPVSTFCAFSVGTVSTQTGSGGPASITVTTNTGCAWNVTSPLSWVTVNTPSGTGSGSASLTIAANPGAARTGTIYVAGQAVTISQTSGPLGFFTVTPCRMVDTREGEGKYFPFGPPALLHSETRDFPLLSSGCGVPAQAQAYSLNFTVVPPGPLSFLSVWQAGQPYPNVSTLNSPEGATLANAAIVPAGANGAITTFVSQDTNVIIDVNGYFGPLNGSDLAFYPVTPCRIADTRGDQGKTGAYGPPTLKAGNNRDFPIAASNCGVPTSAEAYSLNMTVVPQGPLDYLSTWPAGEGYPGVSTLNSSTGTTLANAAIVPAGNNGSITVLAGNPTDLIIDVNGYFGAPGNPGALHFYPVTPCRVADTRPDQGKPAPFGQPSLAGGSTRDFPIPQSACNIPALAQAYSLNVTAVPAGPLQYLSIWPAGQPYPNVSTLNSPSGATIANAAIVPAGTNGAITVLAGNPTDLIIDINGYFAP